MAWYWDSANPAHRWTHRFPVMVDNSAGSTGAIDITVTVPPALEAFWDAILSSGNDIRVTDANGSTLLTYQLAAGFSATTRTCVIQVDNWTPPAASSMPVIWVYAGNADAASAAGSFTASGPITGYMTAACPIRRSWSQCQSDQAQTDRSSG